MDDEHEYIIKMPGEIKVPNLGLGYEIFHKMKTRPDEIAEFVVETEKSRTFVECLDAYTRVAINLRKLNFARDDIIAICAKNHEQTSMPFIAGLFNGNIVACLEPSLLPRDKAVLLKKVTPKILFVDEEFLQNIEETIKIAEIDIKIVVFGENTNGHVSFKEFLTATKEELDAFEPIKVSNNEETAIIVFSSGTTGAPKGVCLSHLAILLCTGGFSLPVTFATTTPSWVSYSLILIRSLREGGARVLCRNYDISQIWKTINKYKVTILSLGIYEIYQMIEQPLEKIDISSLLLLTCSGAVLPPSVYSKLKEIMPNVHILQAYGLTETCGITMVFDLARAEHRKFLQDKPDSCGTPVPGFHYKIVDPETDEILGPNRPGELRVKSKVIMKGYYNEDSSECFDSDGYYKTGDILKYDEDRCFYFVDRLKEIFKFRGTKWSPTALENNLITHPAVEVAAVIGIPSQRDGHLPMGIVKLRPNCTAEPEELIRYVDNRVDEYKKLRAGVKILDDLPVTATGKIQKRKLLDMFITSANS